MGRRGGAREFFRLFGFWGAGGGGGDIGAQDDVHAGPVAGALGADQGDDVGAEGVFNGGWRSADGTARHACWVA